MAPRTVVAIASSQSRCSCTSRSRAGPSRSSRSTAACTNTQPPGRCYPGQPALEEGANAWLAARYLQRRLQLRWRQTRAAAPLRTCSWSASFERKWAKRPLFESSILRQAPDAQAFEAHAAREVDRAIEDRLPGLLALAHDCGTQYSNVRANDKAPGSSIRRGQTPPGTAASVAASASTAAARSVPGFVPGRSPPPEPRGAARPV